VVCQALGVVGYPKGDAAVGVVSLQQHRSCWVLSVTLAAVASRKRPQSYCL
jgi:hypothetical protein